MNTQDFLDLILPNEGYRVVTVIAPGRAPIQRYYENNAQAADAILKLDKVPSAAVYHACATYQTKNNRLATNAAWAKSFWLDVDCGPDKPYATADNALEAVRSFAKQLSLWNPYVILSGRGLHVYWVLEQSVDPTTWLEVANLFKRVCLHAGLNAGPERTSDIASVLRPVGSTHRKNNEVPVAVLDVGTHAPVDYFRAKLKDYATKHGLELEFDLGARPAHVKGFDNDALKGGKEHQTPPFESILAGCGAMRAWAEKGGEHEPFWRAGLGVSRLCQDGDAVSHEISKLDPRYTFDETQKKIDGIKGGFTTCGTFHSLVPAVCEACPSYQKINTPLGVLQPEPVETHVDAPVEAAEAIPVEIPELPEGYTYIGSDIGGGIFADIWDDELNNGAGGTARKRISEVLFYPIAKYETHEGVVLRMRAHVAPGRHREFDMPTYFIAEAKKCLSRLAANEITPEKGMGHQMVIHVERWMAQLRKTTVSAKAHTQMGWTEDREFVMGDTMFCPGGIEKKVILAEPALSLASDFTPKGSLSTWVAIVDRAYNHPGVEAFQFALLAGMAAPLVRMFSDYGGLLVYLYAGKGGEGKTTIERAALSTWCAWRKQQMTSGNATVNAFYGMLGAVSNMPLVIDEMTNMDNDEVGQMVHLISSGNPKKRLDAGSNLMVRDARWETIVFGSGNMLLSEKLAQHRIHNEAERVRVFEYIVDRDKSPIKSEEALKLFPQFSEHYGHAGRVIARYLVDNYDTVKTQVFEAQSLLTPKLKLQQHERYWTVLLSCVFVMHQIAKELGLVKFAYAPMLQWMKMTLLQNQGSASKAHVNLEDALNQMVHTLYNQMIVTQGEGDPYKGVDAMIEQDPRGTIVGRVITQRPGPQGQMDQPAVYIAASAASRWCNDQGITAADVFRAAVARGAVKRSEKTYRLGHGTRKYQNLGPVKCWQVDPAVVLTAVGQPPNITPLSVVKGGKP